MHTQITASAHGTPGEVVTVEDGQIAWIGPIEDLEEAGSFDALFCHEDDEERLIGYLRRERHSGPNGRARAPATV